MTTPYNATAVLTFRGATDTALMYIRAWNVWMLQSRSNPYTRAFVTPKPGPYPFGSQKWAILNDTCHDEDISDNVQRVLHFSSCGRDEFNCKDGSCIPLRLRCNGRADCRDKLRRTALQQNKAARFLLERGSSVAKNLSYKLYARPKCTLALLWNPSWP